MCGCLEEGVLAVEPMPKSNLPPSTCMRMRMRIVSPTRDASHFLAFQGQHTIKRPLIRNIINQQNAHSPAIIRRRNGPEPLLARGIPYLQLDALAVELNRPDLEVDADGRDEGRRKRVFAKPE